MHKANGLAMGKKDYDTGFKDGEQTAADQDSEGPDLGKPARDWSDDVLNVGKGKDYQEGFKAGRDHHRSQKGRG